MHGDITITGSTYSLIPSLADRDLSQGSYSLNLNTVTSKSPGYKFRVSWHSGNGSNTFTFTGDSGKQLTIFPPGSGKARALDIWI